MSQLQPAPSSPMHPADEVQLLELMRSVSETAERLQSTHDALQTQVVKLEHELAEANEQLHRSRELASLGEMAAGIAHEIRNPLASLQLFVEVLSQDLEDHPEQVEVCRKIRASVFRMDTIVEDVLRFASESSIRFEPVLSSNLVGAVIESCEGLLDTAGTTVHLDSGTAPIIHVDASLMTQAISNILRNAIEAMDSMNHGDRRIEMSIATSRVRCPDASMRERVVIGIADRGPGIDEAVMQKLFTPFFTTRESGTGLGLAIAHRVVDAHGGHINVTGRDGGGTRFDVCVPPGIDRSGYSMETAT